MEPSAGLRDFRPSVFGKANTFAQVAAIFFVLLLLVEPVPLGLDRTHDFSTGNFHLHHRLGRALCIPGTAPPARARSGARTEAVAPRRRERRHYPSLQKA